MDYGNQDQGSSSSSSAPRPPFGAGSDGGEGSSSGARGFAFTFSAGGDGGPVSSAGRAGGGAGGTGGSSSLGESSAQGAQANARLLHHYDNPTNDPFAYHAQPLHRPLPHNHNLSQPHYPSHYSIPHSPPAMPSASNLSDDLAPGPQFDIIQWYPKYQSCLKYFVDHAQHGYPCQALAAFINIKLPFQRLSCSHNPQGSPSLAPRPPPPNSAFRGPPVFHPPTTNGIPSAGATPFHPTMSAYGYVSLHPYIRRLVATGFDIAGVLHGWFGDDWQQGIGPLHEQERRNFLFAAKSGGWANVKSAYDKVHDEAIPFVMPLRNGEGHDIDADIDMAEKTWSKWLLMEDWMLGRREPDEMDGESDIYGDGGGGGADVFRGKNADVGVKEERDYDEL